MSEFLKIVITSPDHVEGEAGKISALLENGIDLVHIRKPGASLREVKDLIEDIPYPLRSRLRLHGHFELLTEFNLGGAHLNSRCPEAPRTARKLSVSCHSLREVEERFASGLFEYETLSPVFDSISKPGYESVFKLEDLKGKIGGKNVIALGGVTPERFSELAELGFAGGAMLGCVWRDFEQFMGRLKISVP